MSKYAPLGSYLKGAGLKELRMSFADIEKVTGVKLPPSAQYPAWWSNNPSNNVMTKVWLDAGYHTEQVDIPGRKLVFRRSKTPAVPPRVSGGLTESARHFAKEDLQASSESLIGGLKGLLWIAPGDDLTDPALPREEWAGAATAKYGADDSK